MRNTEAQKNRKQEQYQRLTQPQHVTFSHFTEHEKIDGYFENRDVSEFMGSDRLLKLDSLYGTIQLGYDPKRGKSFIFANIKTSVYDTVAGGSQRTLKEYQMMRSLRDRSVNAAYMSKRRADSAVILFKSDNSPWSERTINPYLGKVNLETLNKTMPFMGVERQRDNLHNLNSLYSALSKSVTQLIKEGRQHSELNETRAEQTALIKEQNSQGAIIYRMYQRKNAFFRKLNYALDIQKHEMFEYYRNVKENSKVNQNEAQTPINGEDEDE